MQDSGLDHYQIFSKTFYQQNHNNKKFIFFLLQVSSQSYVAGDRRLPETRSRLHKDRATNINDLGWRNLTQLMWKM